MLLEGLAPAGLTAAPILEAFDAYSGCYFDLNRGQAVDGDGLRRLRDSTRRGLSGFGVAAGQRVVLCVGNGPLFPATLAALLALGASPILIHPMTVPAERRRIAGEWDAAWILTDAWTESDLSSGWRPCGDDKELALRAVDHAAALPVVGIPLHATSGTTGTPKLALRPGPVAMADAENWANTLGINSDDCILCATPMSHNYAYAAGVTVPLLTGANVACMRQFNPRLAGRALADNGVTVFAAAPAMLPLLQRGFIPHAPTLRTLITAGEALRPDVAKAFQAATGVVPRSHLGTTETGAISMVLGDFRPRSVGHPVATVETRLRKQTEAEEDSGILEVRSRSTMLGYLTADGILSGRDRDGWYSTGDLVRMTPDGQLEFLGRVGDVINVMGNKVLPSEVEAVIALMPDVAEIKVYAGRGLGGSETVLAAIVAADGLTPNMIRRHCEEQLAPHKIPAQIHMLSEMPRSTAGKIRVRDLPQTTTP